MVKVMAIRTASGASPSLCAVPILAPARWRPRAHSSLLSAIMKAAAAKQPDVCAAGGNDSRWSEVRTACAHPVPPSAWAVIALHYKQNDRKGLLRGEGAGSRFLGTGWQPSSEMRRWLPQSSHTRTGLRWW